MGGASESVTFLAIIIAMISATSFGISVFVWSIFRTRAIYYKDFIDRRNNRKSR